MVTLELHSHTLFSEDCLMRPADIVHTCREHGVNCLAVTDHNTIRGALAVQAVNPELVIVGEEIMTTQGELLAYFLKEEVPPNLSPTDTIARLRAQGAAISVSHPFDRWRGGAWQEADLAAIIHLVDALEVFNARCYFEEDNTRALAFAKQHNKLGTVGSDAHSYGELGRAVMRMATAPSNAQEFLANLATAQSVNRRSSPLIHATSTFARYWKRLTGTDPNQEK